MDPSHIPIGNRFNNLKQIGSTNELAREWILNGIARHGDVLFTLDQTAGRGQMGKSWQSEPGQNLAMTILLENASLPDPIPFHLSVCCALACRETLTPLTAGELSIKWPNDLYWKKRKLGGLLIEKQSTWSLAGIGINVNQRQFDPSLPNPVSVKQITGRENDPASLSMTIVDNLNQLLHDWTQTGFAPLLEKYRSLLFGKGESFLVKENGKEKTIRIIDVDDQGALLIEEHQQQRAVVTGLEWMIVP
ncbi:MAG: biotin--[acetyl-CoA-carboxylase] ligase [Bacteroidota bacterium]